MFHLVPTTARSTRPTRSIGAVFPVSRGTRTARGQGTVLSRQGRAITQVLVLVTGTVLGVRENPDGSTTEMVGGPGTVIGRDDFSRTGKYGWTFVATTDVTMDAALPNELAAA